MLLNNFKIYDWKEEKRKGQWTTPLVNLLVKIIINFEVGFTHTNHSIILIMRKRKFREFICLVQGHMNSGTELDRVAGLGAAMPASGAADSLPLPSGCP